MKALKNDKETRFFKLLSPQAQEIATFFDVLTALKIARKCGGMYLEINKTKPNYAFRLITEAIGETEAKKFCKIFGGNKIYFPKEEKLFLQLKKKSFFMLLKNKLKEGLPKYIAIREVSKIMRLSEYHCRKWAEQLAVSS